MRLRDSQSVGSLIDPPQHQWALNALEHALEVNGVPGIMVNELLNTHTITIPATNNGI